MTVRAAVWLYDTEGVIKPQCGIYLVHDLEWHIERGVRMLRAHAATSGNATMWNRWKVVAKEAGTGHRIVLAYGHQDGVLWQTR